MSDNPLLPHLVTIKRVLVDLMAALITEGLHEPDTNDRCVICRTLVDAERAIQDANVAIARIS